VINQKGYRFYVVSPRGIESGWEYREDAVDAHRESHVPGTAVRARRTVVTMGLDPTNDAHWTKGV